MNRHPKLALLIFCLAGALSACETLPPPKPVPAPAQAVSLEEIARALTARQEAVHNVKSLVKTSIRTPERNHTLKQVLLIEGETSLRLDTLSTFGQTLGVLISGPREILLYDTDSNRIYRDAEVWDIMIRTFGTVFDFREYISVLTGKIPRLHSLDLQEVQWNSEGGHYDVSGFDTERNEQLRIGVDPQTLLPVRLAKWKDRQLLYVVQWEDYQGGKGPQFPHAITVQRPARNDAVIMRYNNPAINEGIPEGTFQLNLPDGS